MKYYSIALKKKEVIKKGKLDVPSNSLV